MERSSKTVDVLTSQKGESHPQLQPQPLAHLLNNVENTLIFCIQSRGLVFQGTRTTEFISRSNKKNSQKESLSYNEDFDVDSDNKS